MSRFWRIEEPVMSPDGRVLKGGLWPTARLAWESTAHIKAMVTGYGFGKSYTLGKRLIASALYNSPVPIMAVSPSYKMARRTLMPAINQLLTGRGIKYTYRDSFHEYKLRYRGNTGTIWIGSADDIESLRGSTLASAYIDEAYIQEEGVVDQMLARLRDPLAKLTELWLVGTAENFGGWSYDMLAGDKKANFDIDVFHASTYENKALPASFIETLERAYDEKTRRCYLGGEFVNLSAGVIYHGFDVLRNVKAINLSPAAFQAGGAEWFCGIDMNVDPYNAVIGWIRNRGTEKMQVHITKLVCLLGGSDTVEMTKAIFEASQGAVKVAYPDPSCQQRKTSAVGGMTDWNLIQSTSRDLTGKPWAIRSRRRTPSLRDRYNATNELLRSGRFTMDPSCKGLIRSFTLGTYKNNKKVSDDLSGMSDAATYCIELENPLISRVEQGRRWYG